MYVYIYIYIYNYKYVYIYASIFMIYDIRQNDFLCIVILK